MGRALPDARDGLKPVHRRILYGMHVLKLDPGTAFKKCAKIVGDVMGSFHPHGDQAIYEALVRLAQDSPPLSAGRGPGQFRQYRRRQRRGLSLHRGAPHRFRAAAARGHRRRLHRLARQLFRRYARADRAAGGDADLLANGAQGIAVGMATSIPPHNVAELCDAALHLIAHPGAKSEALMPLMPGPDFPTGGIVVDDRATIAETYRTGRGSFRTARALDEGRDGARRLGRRCHRNSRTAYRSPALSSNSPSSSTKRRRRCSATCGRIRGGRAHRAGASRGNVEAAVMMEQLFKLSQL